ncbi:MAG: aminotransferase class I/II-fold pyridoxal phosphate-dependent enzyme [Chloroflexi bacterium]|nr:aminotransferase class I/II-fold pyridoxal phosphate-dependent enzyme [Chloroflexota bacterium]
MTNATLRVADRVQNFTESVIREMTRLNNIYGGINLSQGYPDFPAPDAIKEAAVKAIRDDVNQYAVTWGAPNLRRALAEKYAWFNGMPIEADKHITVTCGATEAMIAAMLATLNPGDKFIVFQPFYENYWPDGMISGAQPIFVNLQPPEWVWNPDELRTAFKQGARAIILNNPNNPTGRVFTRAELQFIADLCIEYNALAFTDEIYEHIIYDGRKHISLATLPGMAERTITISGISKTYSVTGWRIGYCIAPEEISKAIRKVHDFLTVGAPAPLQEAAAVAVQFPRSYYDQLVVGYTRRRDLCLRALSDAGFKFHPVEGAYYVMCDFSAFGYTHDVEFAHYLVKEVGVASVPGSSFFMPQELGRSQIRFCFPKKDETLIAAGERLTQLKRA